MIEITLAGIDATFLKTRTFLSFQSSQAVRRSKEVRASPATSPARPPVPFFSSGRRKWPSRASVPHFRPDLVLHPFDEPRPSPAFRDALGDSGRNKYARNGEETFRMSCGPGLSAREGGRRPHRIDFRASSSSVRIVFCAL
jgi:hypothetical protein